jgi:hypothetical protein
VIRKQKIKITPGMNYFEIMDVPASYDPEQVIAELEGENLNNVKITQLSLKLPDRTIVNMVIQRERNASNNIISSATDLRAESRKEILAICESAYYRQYEDMLGELDITVQSDIKGEITLSIKYFFNDTRIRWKPGVQVDLDVKNNNARIIGYINVDNNSDLLLENVELKFAEFDLAETPMEGEDEFDFEGEEEYGEVPRAAPASGAPSKKKVYKRVQRLKQLLA